MQIKSLRIESYRSCRIDDNTSAEALGRLKQLELYDKLCGEGCCQATSLAAIGWSKATYYRWRKRYEQGGLSGLERANGASRYEFYPFYEGPLTVAAINQKLAEYQTHYNTCRPHDGIGLLTPMEYYQQLTHAARESHMG